MLSNILEYRWILRSNQINDSLLLTDFLLPFKQQRRLKKFFVVVVVFVWVLSIIHRLYICNKYTHTHKHKHSIAIKPFLISNIYVWIVDWCCVSFFVYVCAIRKIATLRSRKFLVVGATVFVVCFIDFSLFKLKEKKKKKSS